MKKYVKPELFYEHFELSQQIAACQYDLDESTGFFVGDETSDWPGLVIFRDGCTTSAEGYCEHNGAAPLFNIFNS